MRDTYSAMMLAGVWIDSVRTGAHDGLTFMRLASHLRLD
jgi:hypothetical protein